MKRILLSWSSGKDCSWALHTLRTDPAYTAHYTVAGLLTTFNEENGRVAMHGTRAEVVAAQSRALGLPLWRVDLPSPCSNAVYAQRMAVLFAEARAAGIAAIAYGDLWLLDVRRYREATHEGTGLAPLFPIWLGAPAAAAAVGGEQQVAAEGAAAAAADAVAAAAAAAAAAASEATYRARSAALAARMQAAGLRARLVTVDTKQLCAALCGAEFDGALLGALAAAGADACGERGEFHTVAYDGPAFAAAGGALQLVVPPGGAEPVTRGQFVYSDFAVAPAAAAAGAGAAGGAPGGLVLDAAAFAARSPVAQGSDWQRVAALGEALCPSAPAPAPTPPA
jgi:diphthamide synthase (EF-2-diphthine--ammonia ligase)